MATARQARGPSTPGLRVQARPRSAVPVAPTRHQRERTSEAHPLSRVRRARGRGGYRSMVSGRQLPAQGALTPGANGQHTGCKAFLLCKHVLHKHHGHMNAPGSPLLHSPPCSRSRLASPSPHACITCSLVLLLWKREREAVPQQLDGRTHAAPSGSPGLLPRARTRPEACAFSAPSSACWPHTPQPGRATKRFVRVAAPGGPPPTHWATPTPGRQRGAHGPHRGKRSVFRQEEGAPEKPEGAGPQGKREAPLSLQ